jgi:membrane associated rhomboid family serine protease
MPITYILIAITVAISFLAWSQQKLMANLIHNAYRVSHQNEYHRFLTSGFVHQDHMHLLMNMFSLYFFGLAVEHVFQYAFGSSGGLYFIALYLLGIIVSDVPSYFKNRNNPRYNSLGASGGVAAVIFAFIIFQPLQDICIFFALCLPGFILGTAYIIYSWYQGKKSNDNINHDAHLYGALFGLLFCMVLYPHSIVDFFDQIKNWSFLDKLF